MAPGLTELIGYDAAGLVLATFSVQIPRRMCFLSAYEVQNEFCRVDYIASAWPDRARRHVLTQHGRSNAALVLFARSRPHSPAKRKPT